MLRGPLCGRRSEDLAVSSPALEPCGSGVALDEAVADELDGLVSGGLGGRGDVEDAADVLARSSIYGRVCDLVVNMVVIG